MIERLSGRLCSQLSQVLAELQARSYESIGIRSWSASEIEELTASSHVHIIMARDRQGSAQGFLCLSLLDHEAEVLSLAVDPNHWRQGVASLLFESLKTDQKFAETGRLVLEVSENNTSATVLYRKLGFVDIAMRRNYYRIDGNRIDARVMERYYPR